MLNEFRQDLVSGHWVLFSTDRGNRPGGEKDHKKEKFYQPKETCPFENPLAGGNDPILIYHKGQKISKEEFKGEWTTMVIKNKFPALKPGVCGPIMKSGPFSVASGNGFHEVVITHDHDRNFAHFTKEETAEIFRIYKERFEQIATDSCGDYIQIIHNHGPSAGASIFHNHSQILSTPILPPDIMGSIRGSMNYFNRYSKKVHSVLIDWEVQEAKRIVYENEMFICFCPYVSKTPYEMRIFPKESSPRFDKISPDGMLFLADAMNNVMKRLYVALDDPDYNFYIHTSPISGDVIVNYDFYHWHIEILPRISKIGGFELGTNIYINTVDPDKAAEVLRAAAI
jgi:UDPglucose--hexose-1-phosphate uridylyltransferase